MAPTKVCMLDLPGMLTGAHMSTDLTLRIPPWFELPVQSSSTTEYIKSCKPLEPREEEPSLPYKP